jgi:hypothetical protein
VIHAVINGSKFPKRFWPQKYGVTFVTLMIAGSNESEFCVQNFTDQGMKTANVVMAAREAQKLKDVVASLKRARAPH